MKTLQLFSLLIIVSLILSSCGNKKAGSATSEQKEFDLEQYIEAAKAITPTINNVDQVYKILDIAEAKYYPVLTNDPVKALDYKTSYPVAAANVGVYVIDILYHMYGKNDTEAYRTFAAGQELANYIGVESAFAVMTLDTYAGDVMSRDTMARVFNELMVESQKYASEKEILFVHTAFLAGMYAEKMHIIASLIQQHLKSDELPPEDEISLKELIVIYTSQMKSIELLLSVVESQADQLKSVIILEQMQQLRKLATSIEAEEDAIISSDPAELKKNELLNASFETVNNIRTLIVAQA